MWRMLVIFLIVFVLATPALAQDDEQTDFERLMAGEEVELDWEQGVVWGADPLHEEMSPAAELLREFVQYFMNEEELDYVPEYALAQILVYGSNNIRFGSQIINGANATSAHWDEEAKTLYLQGSVELSFWWSSDCQPGRGGMGINEEPLVWISIQPCSDPQVVIQYRDVFTVAYLAAE